MFTIIHPEVDVVDLIIARQARVEELALRWASLLDSMDWDLRKAEMRAEYLADNLPDYPNYPTYKEHTWQS